MPREMTVVREHGYRALVYSESSKGKPVFGHIGNRRWECEWYALTPAAKKRHAADPNYEHDHDRDEVAVVTTHASKESAIAAGRKVAQDCVYGVAIVQEHELEWFVETDGVADWEPRGPKFEVDANGDVTEL